MLIIILAIPFHVVKNTLAGNNFITRSPIYLINEIMKKFSIHDRYGDQQYDRYGDQLSGRNRDQ